MNISLSPPSDENHFLADHIDLLRASLRHWTRRDLVITELDPTHAAQEVFNAPFVVLSHNNDADPLFNYANRAGLNLFETSWQELIATPSRLSAEPAQRAERERLLNTVSAKGFIDDYRGIRISRRGTRFLVEQATVWRLLDDNGDQYGQAATFSQWRVL